jgi:hypothetical protein
MGIFWALACADLYVAWYQHSGGLQMEAVCPSETLVVTYKSTRRQ